MLPDSGDTPAHGLIRPRHVPDMNHAIGKAAALGKLREVERVLAIGNLLLVDVNPIRGHYRPAGDVIHSNRNQYQGSTCVYLD